MPLIRFPLLDDRREVVVNTDSIWKVEVQYVIPKNGVLWSNHIPFAKGDPESIRVYEIFVGGDKYMIPANPNSKIAALIEKMYHSAISDDEPAASG